MSDRIKIENYEEHGYEAALRGLSFNKKTGKTPEQMHHRAETLCPLGDSHVKFLRFITVHFDLTAPLSLWKHIDQYHFMETNSESTMFTILSRPLEQTDFVRDIHQPTIDRLNSLIQAKDFETVIDELPCGYLQKRTIVTNYNTLQTWLRQRSKHKHKAWAVVLKQLNALVEHPEFLLVKGSL